MASRRIPSISLENVPRENITEERPGYYLTDLSLNLSGNMAVSSRKRDNGQTLIDLYSGVNSDFTNRPKLFYSKEFDSYKNWWNRRTSYLTDRTDKIVTCIYDKVEIIDTKIDSTVLQTHTVDGRIDHLVVREGEIFVCLRYPTRILILNNRLEERKRVELRGIKEGDSVWDMAISKDKLFLCVDYRVILYEYRSGTKLTEYKKTSKWRSSLDSKSVIVSKELGVTVMVWDDDKLSLYPINEKEPIVCFKDDIPFYIRILERSNILVTGTFNCEITMYNMADLFTYDLMKDILSSMLKKEDLVKLGNIFGASIQKPSMFKQKSSSKAFFISCEEKGFIEPSDVTKLASALSNVNASCYTVIEIYQNIRRGGITQPNDTYLAEDMKKKNEAWENEKRQLKEELQVHERTIETLQNKLQQMNVQTTEEKRVIQESKKVHERTIETLRNRLEQMNVQTNEGNKLFEESKQGSTQGCVKDGASAVLRRDTSDTSLPGFGAFQFEISSLMTRDIVQNLALVLEFSPVESEQSENNNVKFIKLLNGKGIISSTNISPLITALRQIGQHGVAEKVETTFLRTIVE